MTNPQIPNNPGKSDDPVPWLPFFLRTDNFTGRVTLSAIVAALVLIVAREATYNAPPAVIPPTRIIATQFPTLANWGTPTVTVTWPAQLPAGNQYTASEKATHFAGETQTSTIIASPDVSPRSN